MAWGYKKSLSINTFQMYVRCRVKGPGLLGGKQHKLKQKAFGSVSCFLFEKTDGAHMSAMLSTELQSRDF